LATCQDFQDSVNHFSIKVKWGQNELKDIGHLRQFLAKYPEVFTCDGVSVRLTNPPAVAPLTTPKGKAPPPHKAGYPSSPPGIAVPKKRGFGDLAGGEDVDHGFAAEPKARRIPPRGGFESDAMHLDGPPGLAPSNSKASAMGKGGKESEGGYKGGYNGKSDKGYYGGKGAGGKLKGNPFEDDDGEVAEPSPEEKGCKDGKNGKGEKSYGMPTKGGKGKGDGEYGNAKGSSILGVPPGGAPTSKAKWGGAKPSSEVQEECQASRLGPREIKRGLSSDDLQAREAHNGIELFKTNGTDIELASLAAKLIPDDAARLVEKRCMTFLRSAVTQQWGQQTGAPKLELCGSYAQGTELHGSSLDVAFQVQPGSSPEETQDLVRELREKLTRNCSLGQFEVLETVHHYPHTTSPLAIAVDGSANSAGSPRLVANVILGEQLVDRHSDTLDAMIRQLCDCAEPARELIRLVKLWSVNQGLANHRDGYFNGVAWTLLVVFFLQKQKLIPPYSQVQQDGPVSPPSTTQLPLSTLLSNFFQFVAKRQDSDPRGISVWNGEEFEGPTSIFIEDPAHFSETRQQRSLSETLTEEKWAKCLEEAKKAATRISVRPQRWFHWAEVFDPSERIPTKHQGLKSYLNGEPWEPPKGKGSPAKGGEKGKGPAGKDSFGKGKDDYGKGKDESNGKGKDDAYSKGKDGSSGKGEDDPYGKASFKGKDDSAGKGKDDSYGKGKDDSYGKGKDESDGKGKDTSYGKGKDDSYSKGKDDSQGKGCSKGDPYSKGGKDFYGKKGYKAY
jgi:predicted nucleotidyltransferase